MGFFVSSVSIGMRGGDLCFEYLSWRVDIVFSFGFFWSLVCRRGVSGEIILSGCEILGYFWFLCRC